MTVKFLTLLPLILTLSVAAQETPSTAEIYQSWFQENAIGVTSSDDLSPFFKATGDRRFVLLGESTHGTHEYYRWRDHISRQLIKKKGFNFIGVEGDWENIYRLNNYVKHRTPEDVELRALMLDMERWPRWMWANEEFAEFLEWLRDFNEPLEKDQRVGVFGLDMQDPEDSMDAVLHWFEQHDKNNHERVVEAYQSILDFPDAFRGYAQYLARGGSRLNDRVDLAVDLLQSHRGEESPADTDKTLWAAKQNALAVQRAEAQFHAMVRGRQGDSWNQRASHMQEAFLRIAERYGEQSRGAVWAHNTHVGDARATDMSNRGEVNIGQLLRESEGLDQVMILGFATYEGKVVAGRDWGGQQQVMNILPAREGSAEQLLNASDLKQALLLFDEQSRSEDFMVALDHRAIGVIYRPPSEGYVPSVLPWRYDALFYIDETSALTPLHE